MEDGKKVLGITPATIATLATSTPFPIPLRPTHHTETLFPVEALGQLEPVIYALADISNTPLAMCAQSILAACSLAVQGHADVMHPSGKPRPLSGFFLTVAKSGDGKSSCDSFALDAIKERQRELSSARDEEMEQWKIAADVWDKRYKAILNGKKKDGVQSSIESKLKELGPRPVAPLLHMLVCEEPTFEGLCRILNEGQPSQGIFSDEGGQFVGGHGMTDETRLRTIANLSKFWDGSDLNRVRSSTDSFSLRGKRLSIHLMLQPIIAEQILSHPLLRGQGFLARCLVAAPAGQSREFRRPHEGSQYVMAQFKARLLDILRHPLPIRNGTRNELEPRHLRLPAALEKVWTEFQHGVERRRQEGGDLAPVTELAAKAGEHVLRLAGVLTLVNDINAQEVGLEGLRAGIALTHYYLSEALRLEEMGVTSPDIIKAEKLLVWVRKQPEGRFTIRDICNGGPNSLRAKKEAETAVKILCEHFQLLPLEDNRSKSRYYQLNPLSQ